MKKVERFQTNRISTDLKNWRISTELKFNRISTELKKLTSRKFAQMKLLQKEPQEKRKKSVTKRSYKKNREKDTGQQVEKSQQILIV